MENKDYSIDKRIREQFGKGRKVYNFVLGVIFLMVGLINILKHGFSIQDSKAIFNEALILMGILSILFGLAGREPFRTRYRLKMDNETIRIKKSFEKEIVITLNAISQVKVVSQKFELTIKDYIKTLDFSWMTPKEFDSFKAKLKDYCFNNKIDIE